MMVSKIGCIREGCGCIAVYRDCCIRHYGQVKGMVRRKKLTWAEAEERGLCGPQRRGKDGYTPVSRAQDG